MSQLRVECEKAWLKCTKCKLARKRTNVVLGFGNPKSRLMLVGEGPGENEDIDGIPFVGRAGSMLDSFLRFVNIDRPNEVFIDNIVACRPPDNRKPTSEEIAACLPRLHETIYEVDPFLIVALGATAFKALTDDSTLISKARGELFTAKVPGWCTDVEYPVLAMFHPSYLVRPNIRANKNKGGPMDLTGNDFLLAAKLYDNCKKIFAGKSIPNRSWRKT